MDALLLTVGVILGDRDLIEYGQHVRRSPDGPPWLTRILETETTSALLLEGPEPAEEHVAIEVETASGAFLVVATIMETASQRILTHVELQESSMNDRLTDIFDRRSPDYSSATVLSGFQARYRLESALRHTTLQQDDSSLTHAMLPLLRWTMRVMP